MKHHLIPTNHIKTTSLINTYELFMPTIYEKRCLRCGKHGHEREDCPNSPSQEAYDEAQLLSKQNLRSMIEKMSINYGKHEVDTEIKAEESLMNY